MSIPSNAQDRAFGTRYGFWVNEDDGGPFITGGTASPVGLDLPVGTLYVQTNTDGAVLWRHRSTDVSDWSAITNEIFSASPPPVLLIHNGTLSNNQLVGYSNLTNNPFVVGFRSKLSRITCINGNAAADFSLDFFDGSSDGGNNNGFYRFTQANNSPLTGVVTGSPIFEVGDLMGIYFRDEGQNANDLTLGLFMEAVPT